MDYRTKDRFSFSRKDGKFIADISVVRPWFVIIFFSVWLTFWTLAGISFFVDDDEVPLFFRLVIWPLGWLFAFRILIWFLAGREVITISASSLTLDVIAVIRFRRRTYPIRKLQGVSVIAYDGPRRESKASRSILGRPGLAFQIDDQAVEFGFGLSVAEAKLVYDALIRFLPRYPGG